MKKLLTVLTISLVIATPVAAVAATQLPLNTRAKYCYPTGSYWVNQINTYPEYYEVQGFRFEAKYGATTKYCPVN